MSKDRTALSEGAPQLRFIIVRGDRVEPFDATSWLSGSDLEFIEGSKGRHYPPTKKIMPAWFYILRLQSTHLYCGSTRSLEQRIKHHFAGRACRTTKVDPPIALLYSEEFASYKEAFRREHQVKHWSRAKKEALISGNLPQLRKLARRKRS